MSVSLKLVEDIRDSAVNSNRCGLAMLLRKCRVVAAKLQNEPLEDWIRYESNGYPKEVSVPGYRVTSYELKGHFSGPFGSGVKNSPIPTTALPETLQEILKNYQIRSSVALLEEQVKEVKDEKGVIGRDLSGIAPTVKLYQDMNCIQVWGELNVGVYSEILNTVRNKVLEFALALEKEATADEDVLSSDSSAGKEKVNQIVQTNIHGGNITIISGANNTVTISQIVAGDFNSLSNALAKRGISTEDIAALRTALDAEPESVDGKFGINTQGWIDRMIRKAQEGAWDISVQTAKTLLTESLKQYFGL